MNYRKERFFDSDVHVVEFNPKSNPSQVSFGAPGREVLSRIEHQWFNDNGYTPKCKINLGFFDFSLPIEHYGLVMHDSGFSKGHPNSVHGIECYLGHDHKFVVRDIEMEEVDELKDKVFWGGTLSYALVIDGQKDLRKAENYDFANQVHPRTMIGQKADGTMVIAVADGRSSWDKGLNADQSADVMIALGCVNAINADGGGSSEIIWDSQIKNSPSDGSERRIGTALIVFDPPAANKPQPDLTLPQTELPVPKTGLSPNRYPNRRDSKGNQGKPEIIVLHLTEGYFDGSVSWLCNPSAQASSHIVARKKDGYLIRLVRDEDGAWTNGRISNSTEPVILGYKEKGLNPNLFSLTIEVEWFASWGEIPVGSPVYNALVQQVATWCLKYDIPVNGDYILGHYEIDPIGKPLCGRHIPWTPFLNDVATLVNKAKPVDATPVSATPEPTPTAGYTRVFYGGKQQAAFTVMANAYDFGWKAYNRGHKDVYLNEPDGGLYTFDKHPEDNPDKEEQMRFQVQTDLIIDRDLAMQIIEDLKAKYNISSSLITVAGDRA